MLAIAVLLRTVAFGVVPAGIFATGGRGPWFAFPSYVLCLYLLFLILAGIAVLLFLGLRRVVDPARLRGALIWVQVMLFVMGTAGWLFLLSAGG